MEVLISSLISAIIGGAIALIGVFITLNHEKKKTKKAELDKVKPIIINYSIQNIIDIGHLACIVFQDKTEDSLKNINGIFKNTDNGIAFFDYVETETKIYYPQNCSTIDKNTEFAISLRNIEGETLKYCKIYCHDIFDNRYYYDASFNFKAGGVESEIIIGNINRCDENK